MSCDCWSVCVQLLASDGQPLPVASISRQDVANLCIGALEVHTLSTHTRT